MRVIFQSCAAPASLSSAHSAKHVPDDLSLSIVDFFFVGSVCLFVLVCFVESVGGHFGRGFAKEAVTYIPVASIDSCFLKENLKKNEV